MIKKIYRLSLIAAVLLLSSCSDSISSFFDGAPDMNGERVVFSTDVRTQHANSRAAFADKDAMDAELSSYNVINKNYDLTIFMYKEGQAEPVATSKYAPTPEGSGFDAKGILSLQAESPQMYWQNNVCKYGFKATCGTETVAADQSNVDLFLAQDKLLGYSYAPTYGSEADDIDQMNCHTNKEWYALNKERIGDSGTMDDYKRIPLFLKHQRSWLTVVLKAGNGVKREFLQEDNRANVTTTLFSYEGDDKVTISTPLVSNTNIHYGADINGGEGDVQTTQYDAIVEPYDYSSNLETEICKIVVNNMKFTYYASNDAEYAKNIAADMSAYNLTAGKHLTITATLSTDRVVQITALLEDWDDMEFTSICDDYGQNGDPIKIPDVATLKAFLEDPKQNKAGNTAIISAASLTLPDDWSNAYDLEASLNLAGATIYTEKQFLRKVGHNSTIVNGVIALQESTNQGSAICSENHGTVQQVAISSDGKAKVTKGAVCALNYGTIFNCTSNLAVQGTNSDEYIGGIASRSVWGSEEQATQPIIDKCVVNGRVGAENSDNLKGVGGIVGYAEGRLTNNTFNYGITITYQNSEKYKNIVAATSASADKMLGSHAYNNSWPTVVANDLAGANANTAARYEAVLDCQTELETLVKLGDNAKDKRYRVAADFSVDDTWSYGQTEATGTDWSESSTIYNHTFILDGNNHTITTYGKMLFSHINGEIKNLTIYCEASIAEEPNATSTNVIAPLAYSVNGPTAKLTNVKVRMKPGTYIQASQPSGLVCCAYDRAVISNCEVEVILQSKMKHDDDSNKDGDGNDSRRYMGAIAAFAVQAELVECKVHSGTKMYEVVEVDQQKHTNLYRGGLVGGTTRKNETDPSLLIHDCYSWCVSDDDTNRFGAIIGRTVFTKENKDTNGMREGCQGNWWQSGNPSGDALGTSFAKILGKKNSVEPGSDYEWWK